MIRAFIAMFSLVLLASLGGCVNLGSGTSPSRHYLIPSLADQDVHPPAKEQQGVQVSIMPVEVASYLDRSQLVVRERGDRLEITEFDRWASPPSDNLQRVLKENLDLLTKRAHIGSARADYRLAVEVQRLEGTPAGALVQLSWQLSRRDTGVLVDQGRFRVSEEVEDSSPSELVAGYGRAMERFSRQLAQRLDQLTVE